MLKRLKPSKDRVAGRPVIEYRKQSLNLAKIFLHRMAQFEVNPSIAKAKTISTRFYLDPRCLEESKEKIFAKSWQWIGDTTLIKENGSVAPATMLENFLDEPLLLSRDLQGNLHCLSNVCTHRGNLLIEKACKVNDLRCKYHGRRLGLSGHFLSRPEWGEGEFFRKKEADLGQLRISLAGSFFFTPLGPPIPATLYFQEMLERISWMPLD